MIKLVLPLILLMTYNEWFLRTYEMQSVYPFNGTRVSTLEAGDPRLNEVVLNTPDGAELILWVSPPASGHPTFMYLPGNAGNLASRVHRFSHFIDEGYGVVALAYRGSSGSSGRPSEDALSRDGLLVFDTVAELIGDTGGQVILYGESLGTAVATKIAASRVAHAIILEAPFTSIPDLARQQYPDINLDEILTQFWDTAGRIGAVEEPLLILHGTADELVPFEQGQTVFRLAGSTDKWIEPLEGVGHRGIWTDGAMKALYDFMDRL